MVLKLQSSLCGKSESPRMWYQKIKAVLEDIGFNNSGVDLYLSISKKLIYVSYVDECLFFTRYKNGVDTVFGSIDKGGEKYKQEVCKEVSVSEFLRINIVALDYQTCEFKQRKVH